MKIWFSLSFLLISSLSVCQEQITGQVLDAGDSTALSAVSVYYDGTSLGTVTNEHGNFSLKKYDAPGALLVIRLLGYEPVLLQISEGTAQGGTIYLRQQAEQLAEVVIEPDPWSRKKKLDIFRREFLGNTSEAQKCRIKNEEALRLVYSPSTDRLTAEAGEPLVIINRHLGYEVEYSLSDFNVQFSTGSSGLRLTYSVYYEGTSFFKEIKDNPRKKILRNRKKSYRGSLLHFMRSLASRKLEDNNFRIFHERFEVPLYRFFEIVPKNNMTQVTLLTDEIDILYDALEQSGLETKGPFMIDSYGNHYPPSVVLISGDMSRQRIAHLLPLNYDLK